MFLLSTGTRKSDKVQVAIKHIPKEKVKRWGELDGIVVPIEFKLLHRASYNGNEGMLTIVTYNVLLKSSLICIEWISTFRVKRN